ncbi:nuclear transport factor 2 family protein [Salegentibacter chungangensis]|uniref:Nuclear transport factor 2 family protein n=1 Tax=Salegentibacter chungangensis TaxID=1335724 RepID=A0ABW3NRP5_9FLAO
MKKLFTLFIILAATATYAQSSEEEKSAKKLVDDFFVALHAQDTLALRNLADPGIKLQSIFTNKEGETKLITETYGKFLESLAKIPDTISFKEELHDYEILVNGKMANVLTPYTLYVNEKISHCGVNSFQLYKEDKDWKLIYLVDTRELTGCE